MSKVFLTNIDLNKNQILNAVVQPLATAPANPVEGQIYYNSTDKLLYVYGGSSWSSAGAVLSVNNKTGVVILTQDDIGNGETYVRTHNDFTDTLKGLVEGALQKSGGTMTGAIAMGGFKITNLGAPTADTDSATKKYVDDSIAGLGNALQFKGIVNQASDLPDTHKVGWVYKVGTAGTYVGQVCEVGDTIICTADGTVASNADWYVLQTNVDGIVTGPASATNGNIAEFDGTSGKVIKNGHAIVTELTDNNTDIPTSKAVKDELKNKIKYTRLQILPGQTSNYIALGGKAIDNIISTYATLANGEVVQTDVSIAINNDMLYVTFSIAQAISQKVLCHVFYLSDIYSEPSLSVSMPSATSSAGMPRNKTNDEYMLGSNFATNLVFNNNGTVTGTLNYVTTPNDYDDSYFTDPTNNPDWYTDPYNFLVWDIEGETISHKTTIDPSTEEMVAVGNFLPVHIELEGGSGTYAIKAALVLNNETIVPSAWRTFNTTYPNAAFYIPNDNNAKALRVVVYSNGEAIITKEYDLSNLVLTPAS